MIDFILTTIIWTLAIYGLIEIIKTKIRTNDKIFLNIIKYSLKIPIDVLNYLPIY